MNEGSNYRDPFSRLCFARSAEIDLHSSDWRAPSLVVIACIDRLESPLWGSVSGHHSCLFSAGFGVEPARSPRLPKRARYPEPNGIATRPEREGSRTSPRAQKG